MNAQLLMKTAGGSGEGRQALEPLTGSLETGAAVRRLERASNLVALQHALAREFFTVLRPDRVAVCLDNQCGGEWPVAIDARGRPTEANDLTDALPPAHRDPASHGARDARQQHFPLQVGDSRLGCVCVERRRPAAAPAPRVLRFLSRMTERASQLIEHMLLAEARRELGLARQIQLRLFPERLDLDERVDIAARNRPVFAVSGDYYDCRPAGPNRLAFIVADVMGHGLAAASLMTRLHDTFRKSVQKGAGLAQLDRSLNEVMRSAEDDQHFATGLVGILDLKAGILQMASAGHPWPSILRDGAVVPPVETACGCPWGLPPHLRTAPQPVRIPLGRTFSLLAYTDGLTETRTAGGDYFSTEQLEALHRRNLGRGAQRLCDSLMETVLMNADQSRTCCDDMTVLTICLRPRKAQPARDLFGGLPVMAGGWLGPASLLQD